jgi:hypothetical protein
MGKDGFFGSDWPRTPPYSQFSAAYRLIGATLEADAIDAGTGLFAFPDPERDLARRRQLMSGAVGKQLEELDATLDSDVWRLIADYVRANRAAFCCGGR